MKSFLPFEGGLKDCNQKNAKAIERGGSAICCILLQLNPGAGGKHLTSQLWAAA